MCSQRYKKFTYLIIGAFLDNNIALLYYCNSAPSLPPLFRPILCVEFQ